MRRKLGNSIKKYVKEIIIGVFIAFFLATIVQKFFIIGKIPSESMMNTLHVKDRLYISTRVKEIERGKIYVFNKYNDVLIKRCIGVGGDKIKVIDNEIFLNGKKLEEDYVSSSTIDKFNLEFTIPEGYLLFLGDNRENSWDARYWDEPFVSVEDVIGMPKKIIYPFNRIKDIN